MAARDHDTSPDVGGVATPATVDHAHLATARSAEVRIEEGAKIGRYLVVDVLGEGGMGVVYRAYDPELDRRIALKLVRVTRRDEEQAARARARLLREAQALAKLSHPNVIAIHDAGTYGDNVFLAMELVEGPSLRAWLRQSRTEREILAVFVAAGRGLAAAHDAGLVHRDFKPDNVIVGTDGRVRVLDFGLARAAELIGTAEDTAGDVRTPAEGQTGSKRLSTPLTQAGAVMGTPAYMAPEQHVHGRADARSDQFSFCVALHEALCGRRPIVAEPTGRDGEPAADSRPPRKLRPWLDRIVTRGLATAASARYPDMNALLADLTRDPAVRRRRVALGVAVAALVGITLFAVQAAVSSDRCGGARGKLAGIWDDGVRGRLERAFVGSGRGHAPATAARISALLDGHASAWTALHTASCQETRRGEQSDRMLDLRGGCLQRRLDELAALTHLFAAEPGGDVVDNSIAAVLALPRIETCRDDEALVAAVPLPEDPAQRARVAAAQERLDGVEALVRAGELAKALVDAEALADDVRELPYIPIRASVFSVLATLYQDNGRHAEAEAMFRDVVKLAGEARDDRLVARALIHQVEANGRLPARLPEAIALVPVAEAIIARLKDRATSLATLELTLGTAYHRAGQYDASREHLERALELAETDGKDQLQVATILTNLGVVLDTLGQLDAARDRHSRSLAIQEELLGREHPDLAAPLNNLANVAVKQGRFDEAEALHRRALAIMEKALPPDHPEVATSLNNLAIVFQERGKYREARELYQRAYDINLKLLGPDDPLVGVGLNNLGEVLLLAGNPRDALDHYERAMANWAAALPAEHSLNAYALTGAGKSQLALGAAGAAVPLLERALAIREASGEDPTMVAESRFALARALWDAGRTRRRAIGLAQAAADAYRSAGDSSADERIEVDRWLAARRR